MAETVGDRATVAHALNNVGCARLNQGDEAGRAQLEASLSLATELALQDDAARAHLNRSEIAVDWRDGEHAEAYLDQAIDFCVERDLDPYALCVMGARALWRFWRGAWDAAAEDAELVLGHPRVPRVDRIPALVVLARLRALRGDPGAQPLLDEALELARPTGELHRLAPVAAARAEAAWLSGEIATAVEEARAGYDLAHRRANPWVLGELATWLWRVGEELPARALETCAAPYAAEMRGDWRAAAETWQAHGFPLERALALARADEEDPAREAVASLRALGARRAADVVAAELRERGYRGLPRGPRRATRSNAALLTARQLQVLGLLAEGLSNAEIGARLFIAPKTAEHHVSAILGKLEAPNRLAAVRRASDLGLLAVP
jgi:ATP/maltotriose-dependent transcriptional regulator MalT